MLLWSMTSSVAHLFLYDYFFQTNNNPNLDVDIS